MPPTIAVIEDEPLIAQAVADRLIAEGFDVEVAHDGLAGLALCDRLEPDLVVLDVMLPGLDGIEVCRRLRAERPVPVVMLTARDQEVDVLAGLGVGADDYVTKPFSVRELVARIRAVLRRTSGAALNGAGVEHEVLRAGRVEVDVTGHHVRIDGAEVVLTPTEFALLEKLVRSPGTVFTRERLLTEVWGYVDPAGPRTVDSHVASLRRKAGGDVVRTVHGVGYALQVA